MSQPTKFISPLVRGILIMSGILLVVFGVIGIIMPVLPTTPFLLLAAYFFARSSNTLHQWLMNHHIWGNYLRDYTGGKGIPLGIKVWALTLLWVTMLATVFFVISNFWVKILLVAIAAGVSLHILMIRTLKKDTPRTSSGNQTRQ